MFHVINQCKFFNKKCPSSLNFKTFVFQSDGKSDITVSKYKSSIRCQKQTNSANIHSLCCNIPENYDPNLYLYTEISDG